MKEEVVPWAVESREISSVSACLCLALAHSLLGFRAEGVQQVPCERFPITGPRLEFWKRKVGTETEFACRVSTRVDMVASHCKKPHIQLIITL